LARNTLRNSKKTIQKMRIYGRMANIRTNSEYDQIRNALTARNLFTPTNPYQIDSPRLVTAINSIAGLIPGKSFDITNTVIGRLAGPNTPIAQIGLQQYSKHLAQSVTSYAISDALPAVNLRNLFDGDPTTRLLTKKEDYRITRDETKTSIGRIIEDITNQSPKLSNSVFTGVGNLAPFDKTPNQFDYIRNTGKGQLNQYYGSIGKNLYIQTSEDFIAVASDQGYKINKVTKTLLNKTFFPTNDPDNFPFGQDASDDVRSEIVLFRETSPEQRISEYGSNATTTAMGKAKKTQLPNKAQNLPNQERDDDFEFETTGFGFVEDTSNQIIWGRDEDFANKYGVRAGALLYTKGLLQARGARAYFDQTKKKYTARDGSLMYNGSPLTREIDGTVNRSRQHTVLDPYNNYAKAIRFTGNSVYNAPSESVINKTVIPKFHPIVKSNKEVDNTNMMFSIENLAYVLNDKGYLGDHKGTKVPISEVGPSKGRLMWFAPYNVEVNETAMAKYETTQFIGRSEPLYTYQSSERTARLSFKLIVDYPPQVDGQSHGDISKFFAFGGKFNASDLNNVDIDKEQAKLKDLEAQHDAIKETETLTPPQDLKVGDPVKFYFHNDGRDVKFDVDNGYENGNPSSSGDSTNYGLNQPFLNDVNTLITQILNPTTAKYYSLSFLGSASRLYYDKTLQAGYNKQLGLDRAKSLQQYIEKIFATANNGLTFAKAGVKVAINTIGSDTGSTAGALTANISKKPVKEERYAVVRVSASGVQEKKTIPLTPSQVAQKAVLEDQINKTKELINQASKVQSDERFFNPIKRSDRALRGFEAMKKIIFSPAFHSQTPEDFHRRLTFLHQCTRQGNSVINTSTTQSGIAAPINSVFGRPPICILRLGDMFHSKVVIETVDFDFSESVWDVNPEGMGMQFMIADVTLSMKIIGGQSLKSAIDVIQNAESFNYYANSTYFVNDVYRYARKVEEAQTQANETLLNAKQKARFGNNTNGSGDNI